MIEWQYRQSPDIFGSCGLSAFDRRSLRRDFPSQSATQMWQVPRSQVGRLPGSLFFNTVKPITIPFRLDRGQRADIDGNQRGIFPEMGGLLQRLPSSRFERWTVQHSALTVGGRILSCSAFESTHRSNEPDRFRHTLLGLEVGENEWTFTAHPFCVHAHDIKVRADKRSEIDLVDYQ